MNLFTNARIFWIVGLVAMVVGLFAAILLAGVGNDPAGVDLPDEPTATATTTGEASETATVEGSPTPDPRQFSAAEDVIDETENDYQAVVTTDAGTFTIDLFEEEAPNTVNSFVFLARNGYFDGMTWHRVQENFVIQAGDPYSVPGHPNASLVGSGGPGYQTADEPNEISNTRGTVAMAKTAGATSFGSQFFINLKDNPGLDADNGGDEFYPFGEVVDGIDVIDEVSQGDLIESIEIIEEPK